MPNRRSDHRASVVLILGAALLLGACASGPGEAELQTLPGEGQTRVYEVFGMDCPGCHGGLEKLALRIPGVTGARASWTEQRLTLTVQPDAAVSDAEVVDAVERANFTAGERLQ